MNELIITGVGVIGAMFVLVGFYLENSQKVKAGNLYNVMNFFGSFFLAVYAYLINSIIFLILNLFWSIAALFFITRSGKLFQKRN